MITLEEWKEQMEELGEVVLSEEQYEEYFTLSLGTYTFGEYQITTLVKPLRDSEILKQGNIFVNARFTFNGNESFDRACIVLESMKKGKIIK